MGAEAQIRGKYQNLDPLRVLQSLFQRHQADGRLKYLGEQSRYFQGQDQALFR